MFTKSDNSDPPNTIWKRLDRLVYNAEWFDEYRGTTVTHLSRTCSNHALMLITRNNNNTNHVKYFKLLNRWTDQDDFRTIVQQAWEDEQSGNPLYVLYQKIKKVCNNLSSWSRSAFGDFYDEPKKLETLIRTLE